VNELYLGTSSDPIKRPRTHILVSLNTPNHATVTHRVDVRLAPTRSAAEHSTATTCTLTLPPSSEEHIYDERQPTTPLSNGY